MTHLDLLACALSLLAGGPCHRPPEGVRAAVTAVRAADPESVGIPADLVLAVIAVESAFTLGAVGKHHDLGLMQIRRGGAVLGRWAAMTDEALMAPDLNVRLGVASMAGHKARCGGGPERWLAPYNGGRRCRMGRYPRRVLDLLARARVRGLVASGQ